MDLDFTEEQDMLRELVRGLCRDVVPLDVVRQLEDDPVGYSSDFWKQLAGLDLIGLTLPVEVGGSGMSLLEGAILYEELGRALVPSPHFASAVMGAGTILRAGSAEQRDRWLPAIARGEVVVVPAWNEPDRSFGELGVQLRARRDGASWVLDGEKWHVPFASSADRLLVLARGDDGVELFLVDPSSEGVTRSQQKTLASDTQYAVAFHDVAVSEDDRLGAAPGWDAWSDALLEGLVLLAAMAMGGAQQALELTVQYAKDRVQFDKPLGAFQSLAHYMADAVTNLDGAEQLVHEAAWAGSTGRPLTSLAPMAKLCACTTFRDVTAVAQQIFGGVGFTLDYDIQLYFRRAKQLQISWCDSRHLEEMVAKVVLD